MIVKPVKTSKIIPGKVSILEENITATISTFEENSILAITSKVISICQGRLILKDSKDKNELIEEEADMFIAPESTNYPFYLTIKNNILIPNAGIDESNAQGNYILWPNNVQQVANEIRTFLKDTFRLSYVGVLITDSTTAPLRWGVRGIALAHSGFNALNDYIGKPDIFGKKLEVTKVNVADALSAAAVLEMGEGNEQTPFAIISDISHIEFQDRNPTAEELALLKISLDDDIYAPILKSAKWEKFD